LKICDLSFRFQGNPPLGSHAQIYTPSRTLDPNLTLPPTTQVTTATEFASPTQDTMTSLRTCAECNNILYPREDPDNKRLLYACRHCDYSEIASLALVYRNDLQKSASETAGVTTDVGSDPTLVWSRSHGPLASLSFLPCLPWSLCSMDLWSRE